MSRHTPLLESLPPPRVLPWGSWNEFTAAYSCVESVLAAPYGSPDQAGAAAYLAAKIGAWRVRGGLPVAVDCTGQLAAHLASGGAISVTTYCAPFGVACPCSLQIVCSGRV